MVEDSGLGIPKKNDNAATMRTRKKRPCKRYQIPADQVGLDWNNGEYTWTDDDLIFYVTEIRHIDQDKASKLAGKGDQIALARELTFKAIYLIGEGGTWDPQRDDRKLRAWHNDLGTKGQLYLQHAIAEMTEVDERALETFLSSSKPCLL